VSSLRSRALTAWFAAHKQGVAYALVALMMVVVAGATAAGGVVLHRAAVIERQALRTQALASEAFRLGEDVDRGRPWRPELQSADDAFERVRAHYGVEGARLQPAYAAYVGAAAAGAPRDVFERRLALLESRIDVESQRLAHDSSVTNPKARLLLIVAVLAAIVLVGLLVWQFEMQRRAGRIDRDNAKRSEELGRLKDEFVASVSHELRTPLTSILGYLDLLRDQDLGTEDGAFLDVVARNADRLLRLVSDLLLVAEVEGGRLSLSVRDIDLGALAAECVEAAKPGADARRISLALDRQAPVRLAGDPLRLAQMMDNVVSNAIKFTPPDGTITVTTGARDGHGVFRVADTGPGIPPSEQLHLFDPFFRAQAAVSEGVTGTGLGLTITKAIVDAHRGSITVESAPGAGTTFHIELPRERAPAPASV